MMIRNFFMHLLRFWNYTVNLGGTSMKIEAKAVVELEVAIIEVQMPLAISAEHYDSQI